MKVLVTGAFPISDEQIQQLTTAGYEVAVHQDERVAVMNPQDYDAVVCNGLFLYQQIESFVNLKLIQLTSAGFDRVPMDYIKEHGIQIVNARGVYSVPMAEFAICGVLQLLKQSHYFYEKQRLHYWAKHRGLQELKGRNVCIIGCGSVGTECAKRFRSFGCDVVGVDLFPRLDENYDSMLPLNELTKVISVSDVIILTLPLTDSTFHLFNQDIFKKIKSNAILVNISRGAVIDTKALITALNSNLYGAVLDVFEDEPLSSDSPLWDFENVIITPHNSFVSDANAHRLWDVISSTLLQSI